MYCVYMQGILNMLVLELQFIIAALIAVAAASSPAYPTPAYPSPAYPAGYKASYSPITITAQSDVRNLDGSGAWR